MSLWEELDIANRITQILHDVPDAAAEHHLGRPFLTAYQIAIELNRQYPEIAQQLDAPVGGVGIGQRSSLSQYVARQLSRNINSGNLPHIEGGFLSNQHLNDISFQNGDKIIHSSLTSTQYTLSMFRLREGDNNE